jgi:hypothetical protein
LSPFHRILSNTHDAAVTITQVLDEKTASVNDLLTPNGKLKISGAQLKISGGNAYNGVYFIRQEIYEAIKVPPSSIITNNPSELIIIIPSLAAGTYKLEVMSQYSPTGDFFQEAKVAVFKCVLRVE